MRFISNMKAKKLNAADTKVAKLRKMAKERGYIENEDVDVVVIERNNTLKFLIRSLGVIIRLFASITLITLAIIGIVAIVYPEPRFELLKILNNVLTELYEFI